MMWAKLITKWAAVAGLAVATVFASPCLAQRNRFWMAAQRRQAMPPPRMGWAGQRPRSHVGDWLRRHKDLPPAEQERALENEPAFRRLPPQRQEQLRQRLRHFSSLPPAQQQRILSNMDRWAHLTPAQKQQARQIFGQMRQLPPDRRRLVNSAIGDLRAMPPAQREQLIDSPRFKSLYSPQERDIMRSAAQLPLAPPGETGKSEPPE